MTDSAPAPLGFDPGSFADFTLRERLPRIVDDVARLPQHLAVHRVKLALLRDSLPDGLLPAAIGQGSADRTFWNEYLASSQGAAWRELPFMKAEFTFYRALLDAVGYDADRALDPFAATKRAALETARSKLPRAAAQLSGLREWSYERVRNAVQWALSGNAADLSQLSVQDQRSSQRQPLIDDLLPFFQELGPETKGFVDIVLDNAGEELIGDLVLIDYLLTALPNITLRIHVKPDPSFVSDVTPVDWRLTLDTLCGEGTPIVAQWGRSLVEHEQNGRLVTCADRFWCRPLCLSAAEPPLRDQLASSQVLLLKGDLNYRRYVEDRAWPFDSPKARHRIHALAPALALRVLKSELVVGLSSRVVSSLNADDPQWLYNGKHSLLQYFR